MRYYVDTLQKMYEMLAAMPKPIAVLHFFAGELGSEILAIQTLGARFYQTIDHERVRTVALCWAGCSIAHVNVSDDQIELTDIGLSTAGNKKHDRGAQRWRALHSKFPSVRKIDGIVAEFGPCTVDGKSFRHVHKTNQTRLFEEATAQLSASQYRFEPFGARLVDGPYIAIFDRNDPHQPVRNTQEWQIALLQAWARQFDLNLVVVSDFWPRKISSLSAQFPMIHRNLDLICNAARRSVFYAGPASGGSETAILFGCNFLGLNPWPDVGDRVALPKLVECRGFRHFGTLSDPECAAAQNVVAYLGERSWET